MDMAGTPEGGEDAEWTPVGDDADAWQRQQLSSKDLCLPSRLPFPIHSSSPSFKVIPVTYLLVLVWLFLDN
jgi:hypothetical protein